MCIGILPASMCASLTGVVTDLVSWWWLGIEPGSHGRAVNAHNHCAISPVPSFYLLY